VTTLLEGGKQAFRYREEKYGMTDWPDSRVIKSGLIWTECLPGDSERQTNLD
jgi:hypothetical protein